MTYVITAACVDVMHKTCVDVCPVDCIKYEEGVDRTLFIDPDECIDCGACPPECAAEAIFSLDELPADQAEWTEINALWFKDRDAARARVDALVPRN